MKIALAMICKGTDEEAKLLDQALYFSADYVDGIFITITHKPGEARNKAVEAVCNKRKAIISDFEWCNDFAKARNFNFSQVPKDYEYILWQDSDDGIRGLEHLRPTLEQNPNIDVFSVNYLYFFDEYKQPVVVHLKTQIVKNNGCVEWMGALHEDFKELRQTNRMFIKGIERIHMTTEERIESNKARNIEVSKADLEKKPNDPRMYWNYGQSLFGAKRWKEAQEMFKIFIEKSNSDEEKYLVYIKLCAIAEALGDKVGANTFGQMAIGLKPEYPDAYHLLGQIFYGRGDYGRALEKISIGLTKKPPYYSIIVYNPREYDFYPMMLLAKTFYALHRPDQALVCLKACKKMQPKNAKVDEMIKLMNKDMLIFNRAVKAVAKLQRIKDDVEFEVAYNRLRTDLRAYPGICALRNTRLIKKETSGKDLVYYCGYTELPWSPSYAKKKGVGGSEEAVLNLTKEWAKAGWNITVYCNTGNTGEKSDGVKFLPFWMYNYRDKQDVTILWRSAKMADYPINSSKVFVDVHDVIQDGEFTKDRLARITKVMVKTNFHRSLFPSVPDDKIAVVPNGMDFDLFNQDIKKDQYLIVNTSSPDRSMGVVPKLFKRIKDKVPEAKMKWAYGFDIFDAVHSDHTQLMKWRNQVIEDMKDAGIENCGRLQQADCAKLYLEGNVLFYPTEFAEIDCITVKKAQACGCIPITTDFGALNESVKTGVKIHSEKNNYNWCLPNQHDFGVTDPKMQDQLVEAVVKQLQTPIEDRSEMKRLMQRFAWPVIAGEWSSQMI